MTPVLRVRTITSKRVHLKMSVETGPNAHLIIGLFCSERLKLTLSFSQYSRFQNVCLASLALTNYYNAC